MTIEIVYLPTRNLCRISGDNFDQIREAFSVKNEGAFFAKKKGLRFVKDRIYFITPTGMFEPGLFVSICKYIKNNFTECKLNLHPNLIGIVKPKLELEVYDKLKHKLRDFQVNAIESIFSNGRGVIKVGTGGGKTLTIASMLCSYFQKNKGKKCLLIVPDLSLVTQTFDDFNDYGVTFSYSKWTGNNELDLTTDVVIANITIIHERYKKKDWIDNVDIVVIDECHMIKKKSKITDIVKGIKTNNKIGLTGTLPDSKLEVFNIQAVIGQVIFEKSSFELREEKYLSKATIKILQLNYNTLPVKVKGESPYITELNFIYRNQFRNKIIKTVCKNFNNNILIIINHIEHGEILYNILSQIDGRTTTFIRGDVEVEDRKEVIKQMEKSNNNIVIAISKIFSTGINVKNLHMVVFGAGGKSFIRTVQSIGRGLRLNENKDQLTIIDVADNLKYGSEHVNKRIDIYNREKLEFSITKLVEN